MIVILCLLNSTYDGASIWLNTNWLFLHQKYQRWISRYIFFYKLLFFLKVAINLWYFVLFSCLGRRQCMFEKILHRFKGLAASSHINNNSSSTFLMSLFIQYIQEPKEFIIHACVALVFWKVFIQHCNHNSNDENNLNLSTYCHFNQNTY